MRAPAPNILHGVKVHNESSSAVHATCYYDDHKNKQTITETHQVPAGSTHVFGSKTLDMGGWQAVAPVKSVSVGSSADHTTHASKLEPKVQGVVKELTVHMKEGMGLHQGPQQ